MKTYLIIYLQETDGDIIIDRTTKEQLEKFSKETTYDSFAVFEGKTLKTFDEKFDIGRIK